MDRITVANVIKAWEELKSMDNVPITPPFRSVSKSHAQFLRDNGMVETWDGKEYHKYTGELLVEHEDIPPGEYYIEVCKNDDSLRCDPKSIQQHENMRQLRNKKRKR